MLLYNVILNSQTVKYMFRQIEAYSNFTPAYFRRELSDYVSYPEIELIHGQFENKLDLLIMTVCLRM